MSRPKKISLTKPQPPKIARQGPERIIMTTKKLSVNMSKPKRLIETQPNAKNSQKVQKKAQKKPAKDREQKILQNEIYQSIQVN